MLGECAGVVAHAHELGAYKSDESVQLFAINDLQRSLKHIICTRGPPSALIPRSSGAAAALTSKLILHHHFDTAHAVGTDGQNLLDEEMAAVTRSHDDSLFAYIRGKLVLGHVEHVAIHETNNIVPILFGAVLEHKLHNVVLATNGGENESVCA